MKFFHTPYQQTKGRFKKSSAVFAPVRKQAGFIATLLLLALAPASSAFASDAVRVILRGTNEGGGNCPITLAKNTVTAPAYEDFEGLAFLVPDVDYELTVDSKAGSMLTLNLLAPAGYYVWVDDYLKKRIVINNPNGPTVTESYTLQLRTTGGGAPGTGGAVKLGEELAWGVNLGRLNNGGLAGALVMRAELDPGQIHRGSIASRGIGEQVLMQSDSTGRLRQVTAPEVFVDINDVTALVGGTSAVIGFTADFYPREAKGAADPSGICAIKPGSNYYVRHTVQRDGPNLDELLVTSISGSSTQTAAVNRQSGTWTKTIAGEQIVETVETDPGAPPGETWEITTLKDGNGNIARKTKRIYKQFDWSGFLPANHHDLGTLTAVIADPDGAALTTRYEYYTDIWDLSSCGQIKSITHPDGSWARYDYNYNGLVEREYHPWLDGPASPDAATPANCHVIEYGYAPDWDEMDTLVSCKIEKINGVIVARRDITNTFSTKGNPYGPQFKLWKQEIHTSPDGGMNSAPLVSTVLRHQTGHEGELAIYDDLPCSTTQPDGTKTVQAHPRQGADFVEITYQGMAAQTPSNELTFFNPSAMDNDPYDLYELATDTLYLKPNHSTKTLRIKENGRLKREETHVYTGGGSGDFSLIAWKTYTYNESGRLIQITSSSGTLYEATWEDGFKTGETGADGVKYEYYPNAVMRVSRAVKTGAPAITISGSAVAAQGYIATDYTYNAAGNITSRTITDDGGLSLQETFTHDLAGRLTTRRSPDGGVTTIDHGTHTHTTIYPGGATRIVDAYLDGQIKSETGTGITGVYYDYGVSPDGFRWTMIRDGSPTSGAKTQNTYDWAGRLRVTLTPAIAENPDAGVNTTTHTFDTLGRLVRTEAPGLAPTLYEYDPATGQLSAQGLLCGGNDPLTGGPRDTLDPALGDRVIRYENRFVSAPGEYLDEWSYEQTSAALAGSGTASLLRSHTLTQLNGFSPALTSKMESIDAHGNKTVQTTSIDRANRLVTQTTTVPGSNIKAVSYVHNGLLVSSRDVLGQSVSYDYDPLGRPIRAHRPGKTAIETIYDPVSGRVQKTQFADNDHTLIAAYEYDSAGRVCKTTNAAGATAFSTYNHRGQLLSRHGTGVAPAAYQYDSMGRLTQQTTWRGAITDTLPSSGGPDENITTFEYLGDFALVAKVTDALGKTTRYTHDTLGRLSTLQRARKLSDGATPLTVSYAYDPATGELTGKSYNDGLTPALAYTYNPHGQLAAVTDALGTRTFDYADDETGRLLSETLPAYYNDTAAPAPGSRRLEYTYDTSTHGHHHGPYSPYTPLKGRLKSTTLLDSANTPETTTTHWFLPNALTGRIEVADPAAPNGTRAFQYSWNPSQPVLLHQSVEMQTGLTRTLAYADDLWDSPTRVATGLPGVPAPDPLDASDMTYDTLGRLATCEQSGALHTAPTSYGEPIHHKYTHNLRNQLTAARSHMGATGSAPRPMPGRQHTFDYDNAGARTAASHDDTLPQTETVNALGQVTQKENKSIHVSGVAAEDASVATFDPGLTTKRAGASAGRFWSIELSLDTPDDTTPAKSNIDIHLGLPASATGSDNILKTIPLSLHMPPKQETFTYDADGNLLTDGRWLHTYDAENRLVQMQTKLDVESILLATPGGERPLKITFTYDYLNRRAGKKVLELINGTWQELYHHLYVYNGSALIAEIDATTREVLRTFAWGATGELLMTSDRTNTSSPQTYLPIRDATGSVTALMRAADSAIVATYEYDPNGNLLRAQGEYAKKNSFTYAGGWMDWETGLVNAGSMYYSSRLGRTINTAPSGNGGGIGACYGVAPGVTYRFTRQYARPQARRVTNIAKWVEWLFPFNEDDFWGDGWWEDPDDGDSESDEFDDYLSDYERWTRIAVYVDGELSGYVSYTEAVSMYQSAMMDKYEREAEARRQVEIARLSAQFAQTLQRMEAMNATFKAEMRAISESFSIFPADLLDPVSGGASGSGASGGAADDVVVLPTFTVTASRVYDDFGGSPVGGNMDTSPFTAQGQPNAFGRRATANARYTQRINENINKIKAELLKVAIGAGPRAEQAMEAYLRIVNGLMQYGDKITFREIWGDPGVAKASPSFGIIEWDPRYTHDHGNGLFSQPYMILAHELWHVLDRFELNTQLYTIFRNSVSGWSYDNFIEHRAIQFENLLRPITQPRTSHN